MDIRRATVALIVVALAGVLSGSSMRSAPVALKRDGADTRQAEPTLNKSFGFPVWVYLDTSNEGVAPRRAIYIYLFAEPQHFCENDLRSLFSGLAAEYPPPASLLVTAASDREFLQRNISVHLAGMGICALKPGRSHAEEGPAPNDLPVDTGCFMAEYVRIEGHEEAFEYNPDPHKVYFIRVVLKQRPDPYTGEINADLLIAADEGDVTKARELLDQGADIETKDPNRDTALMIAAGTSDHDNGQSQVAMLLLDRGADVNARDKEGWTPLLYAAGQDEPRLVRALISKGAHVNATNRQGYTPLILAAANDHAQNVKILLAGGALLAARDGEGKTALIYGAESHDVEIVRALIQKGANIVATSNSGESAPNYAVEHNLAEIVQLLKDAGGNR